MGKAADPQTRDIGLLAHYAREVARQWLHLNGDREEQEQDQQWRGFRVSGRQVARQFREDSPELFTVDFKLSIERRKATLHRWLTDPPEDLYGLAEMAVLFDLTADDIEIFIMAAAPAIDPALEQLYSYIWNNVHKRCADVGFICDLLALNDQARFDELLMRCDFDAPLRRHRLVLLEHRSSDSDHLDLNLVNRRVRAADRVLDFLRYHRTVLVPAVDESLAAVCVRLRDQITVDELALPDYSREAILQLARSRNFPVILDGPEGAGKKLAGQALAGLMMRGLLAADLTALLNESPEDLEIRLHELSREARLGGDLIYLSGNQLPSEITGPLELVLERTLQKEAVILGVDGTPQWLVRMTEGWPVIQVPLPDRDRRLQLWQDAFKGVRYPPSHDALVAVTRRYQLSGVQIRRASGEARRLATVARRRRIELTDLDRACRAHFAHQLAELAQLIPPTTFTATDLILPDEDKDRFEEVLLYAGEQEHIFQEWGFAEKFPYGRGLSMLFYGPPGTGKTMGAMIIAGALGLDLFKVDLSRILSRYVGETEKNLARVFDEAEKGRVMLLFDEADSLFTRRTDVQTSVDRYANLEVAYLLQRMEGFEGITVLTTNVEHLLDDAFKRRIRYRIYFPMPDAELRAQLWQTMLPSSAPVDEGIPFDLLGKHYELAGGYIKQAVLRAAVYARRDRGSIGLAHLIEAADAECRELGMLISDRRPKKLEKALNKALGKPEVADKEEAAENEKAELGAPAAGPSDETKTEAGALASTPA
jgi:SpoVK/Ycf46/Vps4 family AAA+-type ATPase